MKFHLQVMLCGFLAFAGLEQTSAARYGDRSEKQGRRSGRIRRLACGHGRTPMPCWRPTPPGRSPATPPGRENLQQSRRVPRHGHQALQRPARRNRSSRRSAPSTATATRSSRCSMAKPPPSTASLIATPTLGSWRCGWQDCQGHRLLRLDRLRRVLEARATEEKPIDHRSRERRATCGAAVRSLDGHLTLLVSRNGAKIRFLASKAPLVCRNFGLRYLRALEQILR